MAFPYINAYQQFFDSSGNPLASGTIEFRNPTTDALINSYPTADDADAQTNANANPLTLNASGAAAGGLYLEEGVPYKVILKDALGATVKTDDDVRCPTHVVTKSSPTAQTLTDAGAVTLTESTTFLVTTVPAAITLADGVENQEKFIVMKTDGGAATLTPTNFSNGTTIVFDDVGDSAHLIFVDGSWSWLGGTATGPSVIVDTAASTTNPSVMTSGISSFDISSLTEFAGASDIAGADLLFVDDGGGGTNKAIKYQNFGVPVVNDTTTTPLSGADLTFANRLYNCDNASAISAVIPINSGVAYPIGTVLGFFQKGAGQITVSTSDTLRAPNGAKTSGQYSTSICHQTRINYLGNYRGCGSLMLSMLSMIAGAGTKATTLGAGSGGTISQLDGASPYNTTVGIRFNVDGTIDTGKAANGAAITWTFAGYWITPNSAASNDYDVRFTSFNGTGGGDWTTEAAIDDIWISLVDAVRVWTMNSTLPEDISFTCAFEVRDGGGAPPATASSNYTFSISNLIDE